METSEDLRAHGGRIDRAARLYPGAPVPWVDLSTGINPEPFPVPAIEPVLYHRLPLAADLSRLTEAAEAAYGRPAGTVLLPVPGSEISIRLLPLVAGGRRVGILGPTYGSHGEAWRAAGREVAVLSDLPDPETSGLDTVVLVNPNNPDGRRFSRDALLEFADRWTARPDGRLVVDEAFADVAPEISLLATARLPAGVTVLRSLGKFFGLAGLRLGFVAASERDALAWRNLLGDWPVSGPACAIAADALADDAWTAATRARLAADRRRLEALLTQAGFSLRGGCDLFVLADDCSGLDPIDRFARHGILVRGFADAPTRCRFGLPGDEAAWQRLETACATKPG
ncbi:threonine-phosphate decarboxylase CobD [Rhodovulum sp. PH10]|uniref:threonine-phosphate decarboxylase CobD n=1 Tax=Rhodovulum sp. PH10 TaxID=1187851 RepID=UPI00059062DB|nr:threonine-phosphate decarboxylase CobD [Rhodovulum sp. PH10]